jgi:hypothetical protein
VSVSSRSDIVHFEDVDPIEKNMPRFLGGTIFTGKGSPLTTRSYEIRNRVRNNLVKVSGSGGVLQLRYRYRLGC